MSSSGSGRVVEDANPNREGTEDRFLSLDRFFILALIFVLLRFDNLDLLETDDVYRRKVNLEILFSKLELLYDG